MYLNWFWVGCFWGYSRKMRTSFDGSYTSVTPPIDIYTPQCWFFDVSMKAVLTWSRKVPSPEGFNRRSSWPSRNKKSIEIVLGFSLPWAARKQDNRQREKNRSTLLLKQFRNELCWKFFVWSCQNCLRHQIQLCSAGSFIAAVISRVFQT